MTNRFKDKNHLIWEFSKKLEVHCPNCQKKAMITNENHHLKLYCEHCKLLETKKNELYSYNIRFRCPDCDQLIFKSDSFLETKETFVPIQCKCGFSKMQKPNYISNPISIKPNSESTYFNTKLWFSKSYKSDVFWALNSEHLDYLKQYISAKLRERNDRTHMTLVETLPKFIKAKKNRTDLLKLIEILENK